MLEKILKLYTMAMALDVRSPMPHLFGPPGCGKSTDVAKAAELIGVNLHIINVARISPLDLEGVQMPHGSGDEMILRLLPATFWTQLREGDILLLDEFLRGFPEVYNGLLDILTSRQVGGFRLPKVFIIGASNSTVSYDKALEDRLLHIPATDPRSDAKEKKRLATTLVEALGLHPDMVTSNAMEMLLASEVLPMYKMLDSLERRVGSQVIEGRSLRNLIGQAQLRCVNSPHLETLINDNNAVSARESKLQYVLLLGGKRQHWPVGTYREDAQRLLGNPKLTGIHRTNTMLNLQLIEAESHMPSFQQEGTQEDDPFIDAPF